MLNLYKRRKAKGLTQEEVAASLGVTQGAVHKWEAGLCAPSLRNLARLAKLLDCTMDELIDKEDASHAP